MRVLKLKQCKICGVIFQPTGSCAKYCKECGPEYWKEHTRNYQREWLVRTGRIKNPGVGTGHAQGFGPDHHSYKPDAPNRYKDYLKDACECCGSTRFICGHHKDRDRSNNDPSNIETLCKRCHQIEHSCTENLPVEMTPEQRQWHSQHATNLSKILKRRADGTYISPKEK
jgi:hypothetical protein